VIPRAVFQFLDLAIAPERGWKGQVPTWFGIRCRIGRATLWLPIQEYPGQYRELSLLALLPRQDLEDAPPFILIGTQFLLEHEARIELDCSSVKSRGRLVIP
jgi:hypothetical protein